MKTLLVSASPRAKGNSDTLLAEIAKGIEAHSIETKTVYLRDYSIHPCIGCEQCRRDKTCTRFYDGMHLLYPEIEECQGLVTISPTYNYNITPYMKAFIDRMYPFFEFTNPRPGPYSCRLASKYRAMVTVGVCEQKEASELGVTLPAMTDAFKVMGYELVTELAITRHFSLGSVKKDPEALSKAYEAGEKLAAALASGGK